MLLLQLLGRCQWLSWLCCCAGQGPRKVPACCAVLWCGVLWHHPCALLLLLLLPPPVVAVVTCTGQGGSFGSLNQ